MMDNVIREGLSFALPLFIMAIGGIYSERSGITNLALEGLQGTGAFVGALSAVLFRNLLGVDSQFVFYTALFFAMVGGMLYSMLHGFLCIKWKANQVISGVVVNILAMSLTVFLTKVCNRILFGAVSDRFVLGVSERWTISEISNIPVLGAFFADRYSFEWIIVILAVVSWYVLYKTRYGLHLVACGDHPQAVAAAGISVEKVRFIAVMISGALSGLAGISFAYSISANYSPGIYMGYGYLAIAAMIFGRWKITPTFFACLIFGFTRSLGYQLVEITGLPSSYSDLTMILPYAMTLFLLLFYSKNSEAPRALGEIYDQGKR